MKSHWLVKSSVKCKTCQSIRQITAAEEMLGDWQCQSCHAVNYGKRLNSFLGIQFDNLAHRRKCIMCDTHKPTEGTQAE